MSVAELVFGKLAADALCTFLAGWNTKIDARLVLLALAHSTRLGLTLRFASSPSNYGTRLDYVLVTPGLFPWIRDSNIQPEIMGSDHCPVFVDFHDEIEIEGRGKVSLWDEMNANRTRDGPKPEPPAFATRKYKEFSSAQKNLMSFFRAGASAPPVPSASAPASSTSANGSTIASTSKLAAKTPSSSAPAPLKSLKSSTGTSTPMSISSSGSSSTKWKGKEKEVEVKPKSGQQSISSFFAPPSKPKAATKKEGSKKKKKKVDSPAPKTPKDGGSGNDDGSDLEIMDTEQFEATASSNADAKSAWSNLFQSKPAPLCAGHNEPTKLWTVNKSGINKGRRFFMCQR